MYRKCIIFIFTILTLFIITSCNYDYCVKIYNSNKDKVVELRCSNNDGNYIYGTGFTVYEAGYILTNKHVIMSNEKTLYLTIEYRFINDMNFKEINVFRVSEFEDLALLKSEQIVNDFFDLKENDIDVGMDIYNISNSAGLGLEFHKGIVTSKNKVIIQNGLNINYYTTDINVNPGCSGSPIFNKKGNLLGIISMRYYSNGNLILDSGYFIPINTIITCDIFDLN